MDEDLGFHAGDLAKSELWNEQRRRRLPCVVEANAFVPEEEDPAADHLSIEPARAS